MGLAHLFLWAIFWPQAVQSSEIREFPQIHKAYTEILKLKIEPGRRTLEALKEDERENGHYYYARNLADILELLFTEDRKLFKAYDDHEDENLRGVKNNMSDDDPYKMFYAAEIRLQWALVKLVFGEEMRAGWSLRSALNTALRNQKEFPDFTENHKTLGLLKILFASVPESYHWVMNLLGMRGNLLEGWQHLEQLNTLPSAYWVESEIIRSVVLINIFNDKKSALGHLRNIIDVQKDNLLGHYIYNFALVKDGRSVEADERFERLLYLNTDYLFIHHIYYQLGEINIQQGNYDMARLYYSKFLNRYKGENFVKDSWFKVFLTFWLEDDGSMANVHFDKANSVGRTFVDADKNAGDLLGQDDYPNKTIMQLRLATDGGFYSLADQISEGVLDEELPSKKDKTEINYRRARLYHKQGHNEKAIFYYLNTIKKAGKANWYFAPNACLNLGYIYQERGDRLKAEHYFNKALGYKKHKYKSGIDAKAKVALEMIAGNQSTLPARMKF